MIRELVALCVVFVLIVAHPEPKISSSSSNVVARSSFESGSSRQNEYSSYYDDDVSIVDLIVQPASISLITRVLKSLIGYNKTSALSLAVSAISWVIKNIFVIISGAITTFGFCKLTGYCSLDYKVYEPVAQIHSFVTPERLETAESFFLKAVDKYAEGLGGDEIVDGELEYNFIS